MKIYNEKGKLTGVACNACGKITLLEQEILQEDFASFQKEWGYFSEKDGEKHSFDLCETCYDAMVRKFQIPVLVEEVKELV